MRPYKIFALYLMTLFSAGSYGGDLQNPVHAAAAQQGQAVSAQPTVFTPPSAVPLGMPGTTAPQPPQDGSGIGSGLLARGASAGPVVFMVLLVLILLSIFSWAILVAKWWVLRRLESSSTKFSHVFWESRSLNDLNQRLQEYPHSPIREAFRNGYAELIRSNPMKDQAFSPDIGLAAAMENVQRTLFKTKGEQKRAMERFLPILALTASAAPFIGLFGTVWGIMNAFEGIAQSGSTSLASVAPGISEALLATAFGLAAAIPAVVGYNLAQNKIRGLLLQFDGFKADFLNIIERYLVVDRGGKTGASPSSAPRL
jgi:biopolymer transport protein TolQ